ncbi:MAG: hypothetical protein WAR37_03765 [Candidatus Microsaccharimonas sp.]
MTSSLYTFRITLIALGFTLLVLVFKFITTTYDLRPIELGSLHSAVVSGATFVIGFILSATIADYKESERIPSEFATHLEDMYIDTKAIHESYPSFDLDGFRGQLAAIAKGFAKDVRTKSYDSRKDIYGLAKYFSEMEQGKVPPNFIVKLKQQQTQLLRARHRVSYIQKIKFIPSATVLARLIVVLVIATLLFTNVDGGLMITGLISFILIYMLILINVISTPFHTSGKTRDDVSLFLIKEAGTQLRK